MTLRVLKFLSGCWLVILAGLPVQGSTVSVGISADPQLVEFSEFLQGELVRDKSVRLLERSQSDEVAQERVLPGSGIGADFGGIPGELWQADVLVRLAASREARDEMHVHAVSTRTGVVLVSQTARRPREGAQAMAAARLLAAELGLIWPKVAIAPESIRFVSVPRIFSINGPKGDAALESSLNLLLRQRLQANAAVVLVERAALGEVIIEREGRQTLPELVRTPFVFGGTIDEFAGDGEIQVTLEHIGRAATESETWRYQRGQPLNALVDEMTGWIEGKAGAGAGIASAAAAEPRQILQRARWSYDVLLFRQALELVQLYHFLEPASGETMSLQFEAGAEYLQAVRSHKEPSDDRAIAAAIDYVAFVARELKRIAQITRDYSLNTKLASVFRSAGGLARWEGRRSPVTVEQRTELRRLQEHLDRLAGAVHELPHYLVSKGQVIAAAYEYRLRSARHWSEFKEVFAEALEHNAIVDRLPRGVGGDMRAWIEMLESLYHSATDPRQKFRLGEVLCINHPEPDERQKRYEELARMVHDSREMYMAAEHSSIFRLISRLERIRNIHRDIKEVEEPFAPTLAYVLEHSNRAMPAFDSHSYARHIAKEGDAAILRDAAHKSAERFARENLTGADKHTASMQKLIREIETIHPGLRDGVEADEGEVRKTSWFWNMYGATERDSGRKYSDFLKGLTYHAGALWCTNGRQVFRIDLDGQGKLVMPYPQHLRAHDRHPAHPSFRSLAVSEDYLVLTSSRRDGEDLHIYDQKRDAWSEVSSPFGTASSGENEAFSDLLFAAGKVFRPVRIRMGSDATVFGIEALDPATGELSYPIRGDRTPAQSAMDVAGNRFEIVRIAADGTLFLLATRTGGSERAYAHAYHPGRNEWRKLSTEEWRKVTEERFLPATGAPEFPSKFPAPIKLRRLQSRMAASEPPFVEVSTSSGQTTRIPFNLEIQDGDVELLSTTFYGAGRPAADVVADMAAGKQLRGWVIPEGLVITSYPQLGFFFMDNAAIEAAVQ